MGRANLGLKEYEKARECYKKALECEPKNEVMIKGRVTEEEIRCVFDDYC